MAEKIWIIDTSSVIEVRRSYQRATRHVVYQKLSEMVSDGTLIFPKHVLGELERGANPLNPASDPPYNWAKSNEVATTRFAISYESVIEVMAHPQVRQVLDVNKTSGADEADPYILALALDLQRSGAYRVVSVITEERTDYPDKLSLNAACGLLGIPSLPVVPFVSTLGIPRGS